MTHKGGRKAKAKFRKIHLPKKAKEAIEDLPHAQLALLLAFIRALMAASKGTVHAGKQKAGAKTRHLRPGLHRVKVGKRMRNIRVLANGRWRFLKG